MNLRKDAKGRPCMVRLPGICCGNPETTILAHYRMPGLSGMGVKADDKFAAWACSACHDAIDRRSNMDLERDYVKLAHAEGIFRTWAARDKERSEVDAFFIGGAA
jgi:hypothetical protein